MKDGSARPRSHSLVVHVSNAQMGGAEISLLEAIAEAMAAPASAAADNPIRPTPFFIVPAEGPLTQALAVRGWSWRVIPWPRGLSALTQKRLMLLPLALPGLPAYLFRLYREFRKADAIWSSGFKSHCACLLLSPWLGPRIRFDVRDFLAPRMRRFIATASKRFGSRVSANSAAVAADYPGAQVVYPSVRLSRPPKRPAPRPQAQTGRRIITHLAYFAPYKGQDLFLTYARKILDAGLDAEFWLAGDVIYPAGEYLRYQDSVYALVAKLGINANVRFLGKLEGAAAVQELLEKTDLLLHCTRQPEPFGRAVLEALLCGAEAVCHRGSGVCEVTQASRDFSGWMQPLEKVLDADFVRVKLPT